MNKDYLLDTNIVGFLTEAVNDNPIRKEAIILKKRLRTISKESKLLYCSINSGEIKYGMNTAKKEIRTSLKAVSDFISTKIILPIDKYVAEEAYADLRARLFEKYAPKTGKSKKRLEEWIDPTSSKTLGIQENDLWLVAVALTFNLTVVSHDKMTALKAVCNTEVQFEDWLIL